MAQMVLRFAYHVTTREMTKARFMTAHRLLTLLAAVSIPVSLCDSIRAEDPPPPAITNVNAAGQQLNPEPIIDNVPFETITTNFGSRWQQFTATGTANTSGTGTNFYLYLNTPGDCFIDDIRVVAGASPGVGVNLIRNGDFEAPLSTNDWIVSPNHAASAITTAASHSGTVSLHMVASVGGTTQGSAIWQPVIGLTNGRQY